MENSNKQLILERIQEKLLSLFGRTAEDATRQQIYRAAALALRDDIMPSWRQSEQLDATKVRRKLYYLSVEFLPGRIFHSNLLNTGLWDAYSGALDEIGVPLSELFKEEREPGLGNGGLGRLAACFMDSLATLDLPAMGCSIRYEFGLFRQQIEDGAQVELPDVWLDEDFVWEIERPEDAVEVRFGGKVTEQWENGRLCINHSGYSTVLAIPSDIPVAGYQSQTTNTLRLWSARAPERLDMNQFNRGQYIKALEETELAEVISKILYPADSHIQGKELRLKQHYFFTAATVGHILREYKKTKNRLSDLPNHVCIQINDTHPGLAIPELMRLLLDEEHLSWDDAWDIVSRTFHYTNHTIMSEALEQWPISLMQPLLPRLYSILQAINEHICSRLWSFYPGQWEKIGQMAIIGFGQVRMANLCVAVSVHVNGVSGLHADILRQQLFHNYYLVEPWKFLGITNGVTHRRWLMLANPKLSHAITEAIGPKWICEPERLSELNAFSSDAAFLERIGAIKHANKERFSAFLQQTQGIMLPCDAVFDVQAKRLHEYKRQLMNVLHVIYLYDRLLAEPGLPMQPQVFLFAAKAYPNYRTAKQIIRLIHKVADMIERTPRVCDILMVAFVDNYSVGSAEILIPAAEISEQISTAGREASGTGNMKFMLNGALTLGTLDGANVEIHDRVGDEGMFLFGLEAHDAESLLAGKTYNAGALYESDPLLRRVLDYLINGRIVAEDPRMFQDLYHLLLFGDDHGLADNYLVLRDFSAYIDAHRRALQTYAKPSLWNAMAVKNIAQAGYFSSDRAIAEYNKLIWQL